MQPSAITTPLPVVRGLRSLLHMSQTGLRSRNAGISTTCALRGLCSRGASGLDTAHGDDAPDIWSRTSQYRARGELCQRQGEWGRLVERSTLVMDRGSDDVVAIQNPIAMTCLLASSSTYFSNLLEEAYDRRPCSRTEPWSIVI